MSNNVFAGRVPLNLRGDLEKIAKATDYTSYRPGELHEPPYRNQYVDNTITQRNTGSTPLRRYPNGQLDIKYIAHQIIDIVHKIQNSGYVTEFEKALLTLILPGQFNLIDSSIAGTMARLSDEEKMLLTVAVNSHFAEELNFNAGRGGGSVPGRHMTRG